MTAIETPICGRLGCRDGAECRVQLEDGKTVVVCPSHAEGEEIVEEL